MGSAIRGKQEKAGRGGNDQVKWRSTNQLDFDRSCNLKTTHTLDPILQGVLYLSLSQRKTTLYR